MSCATHRLVSLYLLSSESIVRGKVEVIGRAPCQLKMPFRDPRARRGSCRMELDYITALQTNQDWFTSTQYKQRQGKLWKKVSKLSNSKKIVAQFFNHHNSLKYIISFFSLLYGIKMVIARGKSAIVCLWNGREDGPKAKRHLTLKHLVIFHFVSINGSFFSR